MFCRKCGKELQEGSRFCDVCGCKVEVVEDLFHKKGGNFENNPQNNDDYDLGGFGKTQKQGKSYKKPAIIAAVAGMAVLVIALVVTGANRNHNENEAITEVAEEDSVDWESMDEMAEEESEFTLETSNDMEEETETTKLNGSDEISYADTYDVNINLYASYGNKNDNAFEFSEGFAWVELRYPDFNDSRWGIINTDGVLVYIAGEKFVSKQPDFTTFHHGVAAIYCGTDFVIINNMGQEVYENDDENLYMCGQGDDGNFILVKHESGFDHDGWYVYLLSPELNLIETGIDCTDIDDGLADWRSGAPIYTIDDGVYTKIESHMTNAYYETYEYVLNTNTNTIIHSSWPLHCWTDNYVFVTDFQKVYRCSKDIFDHGDSDLLSVAESEGELHSTNDGNGFDSDKPECTFKTYKEGSFLVDKNKFVDYNDNNLVTLPTFPEGVEIREITDFSDGYLAIFLKGVDEKGYIALVDETGELQYEPLVTDCGSLYKNINGFSGEVIAYSCGYVFYELDGLRIVDPEGNEKVLGDDLSGLLNANVHEQHIVINEGFICYGWNQRWFGSIDGTKNFATVTANYNDDGELVF